MNPGSPEAREVLRARARALAGTGATSTPPGASLELLEFRLAQERYALESQLVEEVYPFKELTPLPCTPPFILGIVNVRGRILPVLDLKKFFNLPQKGVTDLHTVIFVQGHGLELGILADIVVGVRSVPVADLHPPLPAVTQISSGYIKGVTAECLIVLDLVRLLTDPRIIVQEEVT